MDRLRPLTIFIAAATVLLAACSTSTPSAAGSTPAPTGAAPSAAVLTGTRQTNEGGQVTVIVDWAGPAAGTAFEVQLDTHSVDLDALDLADALLRNDRGETLSAEPWSAPKGGHHREGTLSFRGDPASFLKGVSWVELVLQGVGDLAQRTLRWEVEP